MSACDPLQVIPLNDLDKLKELYRVSWPKYSYVHNFIEISKNWKKKFGYEIEYYAPDGDFSDGSFVVMQREKDRAPNFSFFTIGSSNDRLLEALKKSKLISWNDNVFMEFVHQDQLQTALSSIDYNGCIADEANIGIMWSIPAETALNFDVTCPENMELRPLQDCHIDEVYEIYTSKEIRKKECLLRLIQNNVTIGLFEKTTNTLVAWYMQSEFGTMSILQTKADHLRKGYGALVTRALSKKLAEAGIDPCACTLLYNEKSKSLFRKLGFKPATYTCWFKIKKL